MGPALRVTGLIIPISGVMVPSLQLDPWPTLLQGMKAWLADKQPSFVGGYCQSLKTTKTTGGMIPLTNEASKPELQRHLSMNYTTSNIKLSFLIQQTTACDNHPSQSLALLTSRQTLTTLSFYPLPVISEVLLAMLIANDAHGLHSCQGTFEVVSCSNVCNGSLVWCAIYLVVPVQTATNKHQIHPLSGIKA